MYKLSVDGHLKCNYSQISFSSGKVWLKSDARETRNPGVVDKQAEIFLITPAS